MSSYRTSLTAVWLYPAITLALTAFSFLDAETGARGIFALLCFAAGRENIYWVKHLVYDSLGFALLSAALALTQYFLASCLILSLRGRILSFYLLLFSAAASGVFFLGIADGTNLGASRLCGLPATAACLIGGFVAFFQRESENPMKGVRFNPFT